MKKNFCSGKIFLFFVINFFCTVFAFSQNNSINNSANRRTAVRCLELAKDYAAYRDWQAVKSQADLGLSYDENICDLWYYKALAELSTGATKSKVIELISLALENEDALWVDYNRDNARILYADLLSDTLEWKKSLELLDRKPVLFSADAEYIRAKNYYRLSKEESEPYLKMARDKIETSRKMFPSDTRFALLFFKNENPLDTDFSVSSLAQNFILRIKQYAAPLPDKDAELEIYAASFAKDAEKVRMLKSFNARHLRHPLYALEALSCGLIDEEAAVKYIASFEEEEIEYDFLKKFVPLIKDEENIEVLGKYLLSYNGVLVQDTDKDGLINLYVKYSRGRPANIIYDKNQDDKADFNMVLDFGQPLNASFQEHNLMLYWDPSPYVSKIEFFDDKGNITVTFNLVDETLSWIPLDVKKEEIISLSCKEDFYYPVLRNDSLDFSNVSYASAISSYILPCTERKNAIVECLVLNGQTVAAYYKKDNKVYAQTYFENGLPVNRMLDADDDGLFETTQVYAYDAENLVTDHVLEEEKNILLKVFNQNLQGGFYIQKIQVDTNHDTIAEYIEEIFDDGQQIISWDNNSDGLCDVRYINYGKTKSDSDQNDFTVEEIIFNPGSSDNEISVTSIDGIPVSVKSVAGEMDVIKDSYYDIYWLGSQGTPLLAKKVLKELNLLGSQGVSTVVSEGNMSVLCVKVEGKNYAYLTLPQEYQELERQRQIEERKKAELR